MRKNYFLLVGLFISSMCVFAQKNGAVKGIAFDTLSKQPVAAATITVMLKKDSSLVTFTITDNRGYFELKGIPNGEYRLLITHVSYHNNNQYFTIDDNKKFLDLGNIPMNDKSKVLEEVVVMNEAPPVTLINDTVQYNAGSFKTPPNANVEQLLKKLPGIQVQKDGSIKAQGEKVQKVLVDGKEFFGNDPKIATKNLPADAIDKVQVYDKQSDQAQLTGFDDGNYEKTINLKLKQDKKKGMFGKVNAGGGNNERYQGKFNVNSFKGARQVSAIGMGNNTNSEGFSFMDILNFTGALNQAMKGGGGNINININSNEASGFSGMGGNNNSGINTAWGGGVNYNNIIGKKIDWQSNYFYNRYNPNTESHIQRQYPSGSIYNQNSFADNLNNSQRVNMNILYQIDSANSIKFIPSFSYQKTRNESESDYQTFSKTQSPINEGISSNLANSEGFNFANNIIYRRKFDRKGRTFSLSLQTNLNGGNGDGSPASITGFYNSSGSLLRRDTLNQRYNDESDLNSYNAKAIYTEPMFKKSLFEFSVGKSNNRNTLQKTTYDYNKLNGKYDQLNIKQTSDFANTYGYTTAGLRIRTQKRKYNYLLGLTWQQAELEGKILTGLKDSVIGKMFRNLLPNARFQYNFSKFKTLSINYNTNTTQPTMRQLQPVPDISDRLNIWEGNPYLKQELTNMLMGHLSLVSPYKNKSLFFFFNLQRTQDKIVNYDSLDQFGVRYTRPVNVNGVYNLSGNLNWGMPARFLKGTISIGNMINYLRNKQFVNTGISQGTNTGTSPVMTTVKTLTLGPDIRLDMNPDDKLNISLLARLNYNRSIYSLVPSLNTKYFQQEYETDIDWQLPKGFFFSADFTYTINSQRASGFNVKVPIWNAGISKQMLRYNRGELKFSATDLLNRNIGISRTTNQNYIEDSRVKTLRRFFLLSFTYSLSKTGLNNAGAIGGMKVITR
jgi:hypothetical protein